VAVEIVGPATRWWNRCLLILGTYVVAADFFPNVLLVLVSAAGYLPYSDRPGPGWHAPPHLPARDEVEFAMGFARSMLAGTAIFGAIFAAGGCLLGFCSLPRWALRVVATPTAFLASGLMMAAVGWYISIAPVGVWLAAGCGGLWGLLVFPRLAPRMKYVLPGAVRLALPVAVLGGGIFLLVRPFLPDPGLTNAKIEVIRRSVTGESMSALDLSYVGLSAKRPVQGSGKYASAIRMKFTTDDRNQASVLLIVEDDQAIPGVFRIPRSGFAIYRQSQGNWTSESGEFRESKVALVLNVEASGRVDLTLDGPCCSSKDTY
jgi:hypothetical protein